MPNPYKFLSGRSADSVFENLRKYGIAVVPRYLDESVLKSLNQDFERSLKEKASCIFTQEKHPVNEEGKTARMNPWHPAADRELPAITAVFRDPLMRAISEAFFAPYPYNFNEEVFITNEFPSEVNILPWHFDRMQSLKFWFNLTDTRKANGAFEYCPGSHWEGHYRASYHMAMGRPVQNLPNDIDEGLIRDPVTIELDAGDLLVFDPGGFHRGGVVSPGQERRVIRAHTHPANGRRYTDKRFSPGWWISSRLNINRWFGSASARVLGKRMQDNSMNREEH